MPNSKRSMMCSSIAVASSLQMGPSSPNAHSTSLWSRVWCVLGPYCWWIWEKSFVDAIMNDLEDVAVFWMSTSMFCRMNSTQPMNASVDCLKRKPLKYYRDSTSRVCIVVVSFLNVVKYLLWNLWKYRKSNCTNTKTQETQSNSIQFGQPVGRGKSWRYWNSLQKE